MWRMLQHDEPEDFVIATGTSYRVRSIVQFAFDHAALDWEKHVAYDDRYERAVDPRPRRCPTEVKALVGDACKARELLGWKAETLAPELARVMVGGRPEPLRGRTSAIVYASPCSRST
jgi:GDPmannose 4,6-dehydratase